jgi:hypothetical protein
VVEVLLILAAFGVLALASHLLTPPEPQTPPVAASAAA